MRVLFASTAGAGHFYPMVPFIDACRAQDHDVLVAGPPGLAGAVEARRYQFWEFYPPPEDELGQVWSRLPQASPDEQNVIVIGDIFGRLNSTASLPGLRRACEEWRPDVVVRDPNEYGSAIAADLAGIPHTRVGIGLVLVEELGLEIAAKQIDAIRRSAGLPSDPDADTIGRTPWLTMFPASMEDPSALGAAVATRYADPEWDEPSHELPDWWPPDMATRPLVYVTFGSVAGGMEMVAHVYGAAIEAAEQLDARILLTVGAGADIDGFGRPPANVHIEAWVPQADVLGHAATVVCHGGSGSTLGALAAGVPTVVIPLFADQPYNAARVEATGAGITVTAPTADSIRRAVETALGEVAYRSAAGRVAAEMRGHPPASAAVDLIASL